MLEVTQPLLEMLLPFPYSPAPSGRAFKGFPAVPEYMWRLRTGVLKRLLGSVCGGRPGEVWGSQLDAATRPPCSRPSPPRHCVLRPGTARARRSPSPIFALRLSLGPEESCRLKAPVVTRKSQTSQGLQTRDPEGPAAGTAPAGSPGAPFASRCFRLFPPPVCSGRSAGCHTCKLGRK